MSEFVFELKVNEGLQGKALMIVTPGGTVKYTAYINQLKMKEIAWHAKHVHEEHPDWDPRRVLAMAVKIVLIKSEKNAN